MKYYCYSSRKNEIVYQNINFKMISIKVEVGKTYKIKNRHTKKYGIIVFNYIPYRISVFEVMLNEKNLIKYPSTKNAYLIDEVKIIKNLK